MTYAPPILAGLLITSAVTSTYASDNYVAEVKELNGSCFMRNEKRTSGHQLKVADNLRASDEVQCARAAFTGVRYFETKVTIFLEGLWQPVGNIAGPSNAAPESSVPSLGRHAYMSRIDAEFASSADAMERQTQDYSNMTIDNPVRLYKHLGDAEPLISLDADDFPWEILASTGHYYRVKAGSYVGWVDSCVAIDPGASLYGEERRPLRSEGSRANGTSESPCGR